MREKPEAAGLAQAGLAQAGLAPAEQQLRPEWGRGCPVRLLGGYRPRAHVPARSRSQSWALTVRSRGTGEGVGEPGASSEAGRGLGRVGGSGGGRRRALSARASVPALAVGPLGARACPTGPAVQVDRAGPDARPEGPADLRPTRPGRRGLLRGVYLRAFSSEWVREPSWWAPSVFRNGLG